MGRLPNSTDGSTADQLQQAYQGTDTALGSLPKNTDTESITIPPWHLLKNKRPARSPARKVHRINLPAGKGGLGKTTLTNLLGSVAAFSARQIEIYDLCSANPSAKRLFKLGPDRLRGSLDKTEIGQTVMNDLYPHLENSSVIGDLGGSAEVPLLDFLQENELLDFLGEQLLFHVLIGPLDSIGTARSIATRAPGTPVVLYLNHRDKELRMVIDDPKRRALLDALIALPNVVAVLELPDLSTPLTICSRVSSTLHDAATHPDLSLIERAVCSGAMKRVDALFAPIREWLP